MQQPKEKACYTHKQMTEKLDFKYALRPPSPSSGDLGR